MNGTLKNAQPEAKTVRCQHICINRAFILSSEQHCELKIAARHKLVKQAQRQITDPPERSLTQKAAFSPFRSVTAIEVHVRG